MRFAAAGNRWVCERRDGAICEIETGEPLEGLERILGNVSRHHPEAGAIGYISYEAGYRWVGLSLPEFRAGAFPIPEMQFLVFDCIRSDTRSRNPEFATAGKAVYAEHDLLAMARADKVQPIVDRMAYVDAITRIKEYISAGDIYQANYTQAFDVQTDRDGLEIYEDLAASNPAPFAAYLRFPPLHWISADGAGWDFPACEIISNSPERFWKKSGSVVETRPIKGTIARGRTGTLDRENLRILMSSDKDRAELLMITDLERNDLGRVAQTGSVKVEALRRARACPSIWHLESIVTAQVGPEVKWPEIMRAMFPGGSITGAPKRRAIEILRGLEPVPRGVYCGAIGWIGAKGDADFSIAIRTALKVGRHVRVHGGGGIVADSDPLAEYHESLIKIAPLLECLCR
ncbi:MAG: anthranilate synthase component I family protein [candidate division Zixibacteria bacterium]|nr:anthranilate synthase component I family protein [candidate division Zixibacteria bacterium]